VFRIFQLIKTLPPSEETQCHYYIYILLESEPEIISQPYSYLLNRFQYLIWIYGFAIRLCEVVAFDMSRDIQIIAEYLAKSDLDQITVFILRNVALLPNRVIPELLKMGNVVYMNLISCEVGRRLCRHNNQISLDIYLPKVKQSCLHVYQNATLKLQPIPGPSPPFHTL
jgi:hypothetical protein